MRGGAEMNSMLDAYRRKELRDNLLVTIGSRAAYMDVAGHIELPEGTHGEDELARFASKIADKYIEDEIDVSFDEYIESALEKRFSKEAERSLPGCLSHDKEHGSRGDAR